MAAGKQNPIEFSQFKLELRRRIEEAITKTAEHAAFLAREEAPVRKIFKGSRRSLRQLSSVELKAEQTSRRNLFGDKAQGPIFIERERQRFFGGQPRVLPSNPNLRGFGRRSQLNSLSPQLPGVVGGNPRQTTIIGGQGFLSPSAEGHLNSKGRAEVRSGRANFTLKSGKQIVGGTLRNSITVGPLESHGSKIKQTVFTSVHYAKYVEFGTRHAAGQPFLRPALAKVREEYRSRIIQAVQQTRKHAAAGGKAVEIAGRLRAPAAAPTRNDIPVSMEFIESLRPKGGGMS